MVYHNCELFRIHHGEELGVVDLIDLYFKLCGTNMLHKKQIIHKIYNEMTDRQETRIIYCQLNVLCSRV